MPPRGALAISPPKLTADAESATVPRTVKTVPAIHASAAVEAWYKSELQGIVLEAHLDLTRIVHGHIAERTLAIAPLAMDAGPTDRLDAQLKAWAKKWQVHFDKVSVTLARKFAKKNFGATEASMQAALGAMAMGATARRAVEVACDIDPTCGLPLTFVKLSRN